jgi:uncharacterized protein
VKGVDLLIIQPTPFCNINCDYCYLPERSNTQKISLDTVGLVIDSLVENNMLGKRLSVVWHAGEPLVLSPSFYRPFFDLISSKLLPVNVSWQHSVQTNGTLITQEWCDFIIEKEIKIGVSIDGPKEVHDANRKTRSGKGTFDKVMHGIQLLRDNHINFHAISVVSKYAIDDPDSFFEFFYNSGIYDLGLNIEEVEGDHVQSSIFDTNLQEKVKAFYSRLFDLYMASDKKMRIREFDRSLEAILRNPGEPDIKLLSTETHQNTPMAIVSLDYRGNYSTFSPELIGQPAPAYNNFILGNIHRDNFSSLQANELLKSMTGEINAGIQKCREECEYFYVCGGGAPANKYFENGSFNSSETNYCKHNIKIPTELVLSYLEENLAAW